MLRFFRAGTRIRELEDQIKELKSELKFYVDKSNSLEKDVQECLQESIEYRNESAVILKKMVNVQMLAAGSKAVMFDEVGPHSSATEHNVTSPIPRMPTRAKQLRAKFVEEYMQGQYYTETEPPKESKEEEDSN